MAACLQPGCKYSYLRSMNTELLRILAEKGVKPTANRLVILRALCDCGHPVTMSELEERIDSIDKSGIFRTLILFQEHHMLHTIDDGCNGVRYELCHAHGETDDDHHVHFHCEKCHRTICLEEIHVPDVKLPDGYRVDSVNYMLKGLCPDCARHER